MDNVTCGYCRHVEGDDEAQEAGCRLTGNEAQWQTPCYFGPVGPDGLTSAGVQYAIGQPLQFSDIQHVWPAAMIPEVTNLVAAGIMSPEQALINQERP